MTGSLTVCVAHPAPDAMGTRPRLSRIIPEFPRRGHRLVELEEVAQAGRIAASNRLFGHVMSSFANSRRHPSHGHFGIRATRGRRGGTGSRSGQIREPGSERSAGQGGLEREAGPLPGQLAESGEHDPARGQCRPFGLETRESPSNHIGVDEIIDSQRAFSGSRTRTSTYPLRSDRPGRPRCVMIRP